MFYHFRDQEVLKKLFCIIDLFADTGNEVMAGGKKGFGRWILFDTC